MSIPDRAPVAPTQIGRDEIAVAVADLDRRLRRLHVARSDRRAIVDDVRGDLQSAAADGVRPAALIGPDVDAFAQDAIEQGGYRAVPSGYARTVAGGVLGLLAGLVVAYLLVVVAVQPLLASWFTLDRHYPAGGPIVAATAVAVLALLGALVVLGWVLRGRAAARATVRRAGLLLPAGVVVGTVVAVAAAPDGAVGSATVALVVLCEAVSCVAALGVSRWWALRSDRP